MPIKMVSSCTPPSIRKRLHSLSPKEMVSNWICGSENVPQAEKECDECKSRETRISRDSSPSEQTSSKSSKNLHSKLDKFSSFLSKLEEKRNKIYSQLDPKNETFLVRFECSDDHDFKPIVVELKPKPKTKTHNQKQEDEKPLLPEHGSNQKQEDEKLLLLPEHGNLSSKLPSTSSTTDTKDENHVVKEGNLRSKLPSTPSTTDPKDENHVVKEGRVTNKKKIGLYRKLRFYQWDEPSFYLPVIFILILMFLVLFGKSFTIMCTSIGWYALPTIMGWCANNGSITSKLKRPYTKKCSTIK